MAELARHGHDAQLARALESSRLVGGALLKHEDEELQQIAELAEEILKQEYR